MTITFPVSVRRHYQQERTFHEKSENVYLRGVTFPRDTHTCSNGVDHVMEQMRWGQGRKLVYVSRVFLTTKRKDGEWDPAPRSGDK